MRLLQPNVREEDIDKQLAELKSAYEKSKNPCLKAVTVALADGDVRRLFIDKVRDGYVYRGVSCLAGPHVPEIENVLFDFDCKPGTFCLVKPWFLVTVDIINLKVQSVEDPYLPYTYAPESAVSSM